MPERVVIIGGGVGGLTAALALGRAGHPVTILEHDPLPPTADAEEAFVAERRGAPQVHQTHGFLARLQVLLRERFPDVLADLLSAGGSTVPMTRHLGPPQPGDEDLQVIVVRRTTLEWVLRKAAIDQADVDLRTGVHVSGLVATRAGDGPPLVTGVRLDDGGTIDADIVVASTGRRGDIPGWLGELDVAVPETVHESGLMYLTRWYKTPPTVEVPVDAKLGGDLGFVKFLGIPGDGGTLSITLAVRTTDSDLRSALSDPERFELACHLLPGPDIFFQQGPLEPIGTVRPMTGLLNRIRRFTDEAGRPTVLGFHVIGDAHTTTNPLYGRGCSLAAVQATLLADAVAAHPGDPDGRAAAFEAASTREVEPWFDASVQMDRMGADPSGRGTLGRGGPDSEAAKMMGAVFAAAATDPILGRAMARLMNLLALPAEVMSDPVVLGRVAEVLADPAAFPPPTTPGPSRSDLLDALTTSPAA